mgnify:CR=1 FL=1
MRNFDLSPLYRTSIGFDRVANLLDSLVTAEQSQPNYPPYNIELTGENAYRITMAVAGFSQDDLDIEVEQNHLTVRSTKRSADDEKQYLHRGIAERNFERRFQLADHVRVESANYENGLLHIELVRELPEVLKPRTIAIGSGPAKTKEQPKLEEVGKDAADKSAA